MECVFEASSAVHRNTMQVPSYCETGPAVLDTDELKDRRDTNAKYAQALREVHGVEYPLTSRNADKHRLRLVTISKICWYTRDIDVPRQEQRAPL